MTVLLRIRALIYGNFQGDTFVAGFFISTFLGFRE